MTWLFESRKARMFDEKGNYHGTASFSKKDKTFDYGKGSYNVDEENATVMEGWVLPVIWKEKIYYYNITHSNPIRLDKKSTPMLSPELYNINLKSKVARDLNNVGQGSFLDNLLTPTNIIIALVVIGGILYITSNGGLGSLMAPAG